MFNVTGNMEHLVVSSLIASVILNVCVSAQGKLLIHLLYLKHKDHLGMMGRVFVQVERDYDTTCGSCSLGVHHGQE